MTNTEEADGLKCTMTGGVGSHAQQSSGRGQGQGEGLGGEGVRFLYTLCSCFLSPSGKMTPSHSKERNKIDKYI